MKKILFIDDNKLTSDPIRQDLIGTYYLHVTMVDDADKVMRLLEKEKYDAIILDVMMTVPENWNIIDFTSAEKGLATGLVLFKNIRILHPQIPILILSVRTNLEIEESELVSHLTKPCLIKEIYNSLEKLLNL